MERPDNWNRLIRPSSQQPVPRLLRGKPKPKLPPNKEKEFPVRLRLLRHLERRKGKRTKLLHML